MSINQIEELFPEDTAWKHHCEQLNQADSFSAIIWCALQAGLWVARWLAQQHLREHGSAPTQWPPCPLCGRSLQSKGLRKRQLKTLIGQVSWSRRVGRCPKGCKGTQRILSDEALGITPYQSTEEGLLRLGCLFSVMLPYQMASWLLGQFNGITLSTGTLWTAVQHCGASLVAELEHEIEQFENGQYPKVEALSDEIASLPLAIACDGVMVPFRPQAKTAQGKTRYREVKIGLLARLERKLTGKGERVMKLRQRRVVGVLGDIDAFMPRVQLEAYRQSFESAPEVLWLSDGAKGLWRVYETCFKACAVGILDFYHAAGHLWRAAAVLFDGRSKIAKKWFGRWRHQLRHGEQRNVIRQLTQVLNSDALETSEVKTLSQVQDYFQRHREHIRYQAFEDLDYPLGSGMIESTCKWMIQQRFKGVGMRWSEEGFNHLFLLRMAWVNRRFDSLFPHVNWVEHLPSPIL